MSSFGFEKPSSSLPSFQWLGDVQVIYVLGLLFFFVMFSGVYTLVNMWFSFYDGEYFSSLEHMAAVLSPWDKDVAAVSYYGQEVAQALVDNTGLFPEHKQALEQLFLHGSVVAQKWGDRLPEDFHYLRLLFAGLAQYKEDIYSLLGQDSAQTYLVILQNTAEKRPNGGFFGSFARVTLDKGRVEEVEVIDSYLPGFDKPGTYITGPSWLLNFLPEREIYFVGANKVGFTYHDGASIKTLYEKSYPGQRVRGVVFISTDMFEEVVPGFREQLREWQFINASVDLIRGGDQRGKKELYLASANDYFAEHADEIIQHIGRNLGILIEQRYINMYLTDISGSMHTWLRKNKLTTRFEEDTMYFWDSNISYSKVDAFVNKIIQFRDTVGNVVIETMEDVVEIDMLAPGTYTVTIIYNVHVPSYYLDYIAQLEQKYGIELGEREIHILAVLPRWATRGVIYMPKHIQVTGIDGDRYHEDQFTTPFSRNVYYKSKMLENNRVSEVVMEIEISE